MNKYTLPEDQIRLAEFMGWKRLADDPEHPRYDDWFPPNNWKRSASTLLAYHTLGLPDPLNSHANCHALIEALNRDGWRVEFNFANDGEVWTRIKRGWEEASQWFKDYRTGVVTMALKVI